MSEANNGRHSASLETRSVHENGDSNNGAAPLEEGPLLPSKTAGGPDLGVPGAKSGTIYREKQVKVQNFFLSLTFLSTGALALSSGVFFLGRWMY